MPGGEAALDLVVDRAQQAEWLEGVQPAYPLDERTRAAERRLRTQKKFEELTAHPSYSTVLNDLTAYVNAVIPWPSVTGGLYWGVSAMPGTGARHSGGGCSPSTRTTWSCCTCSISTRTTRS